MAHPSTDTVKTPRTNISFHELIKQTQKAIAESKKQIAESQRIIQRPR